MTDNQIVPKYSEHQDFAPQIERVVEDISKATGFVRDGELQRRTIYDPNKVWRVRIAGAYQGKPAVLRVENLKLEEDEEGIRQAFRAQATGTRVRPPETYAFESFDEEKGHGYSIDEDVGGAPLFDPAAPPAEAAQAFAGFYRELRKVVTEPFWENQSGDIRAFSVSQLEKWLQIARERDTAHTDHVQAVVTRIQDAYMRLLPHHSLRFQHAHLSGTDVRVNDKGEYIVFANHFWSWRQPAYDVAFPLWHQWMALPPERRTAEEVRQITQTWIQAIGSELADLVNLDHLRPMLLNRLYGSLLLDIPAKLSHADETAETVQRLEDACIAEAERLL